MGIYVNPNSRVLLADMQQDIYVDKSKIITELNKVFGTSTMSRICVSRPRRFGKTMVGNLISTYYSKGADSRAIFEKLKIAETENWDERLNKCNVLKIDLNDFWNDAESASDVIPNLTKYVMAEMKEEFPGMITIEETIPKAILAVYKKTGVPFVVIIDEYDVMVRERVPESAFESYLKLMSALFKGAGCMEAIGLAYITGIIPIVKDKVGSKLNNFKEYSMLMPRDFAPYIGFTLSETKELCERFNIDYDECLRWYDGYKITPEVSICNSNSVCEAISTRTFANYWNRTGAYAAISDFVKMDFDGIKEDIATMIGGGSVPVKVGTFSNTLSDLGDKDRVFTYLCHLGYLVYDDKTKTCSIPNGEIRDEWDNAISDMKDMSPVIEMIRNSERLLKATLAHDEQAVATALDKAHKHVTSALTYNNEGALQSAVGLAYFSATSQYTIHRELAAGDGFADIAFVPYVKGMPGIIMELKMDKSPDAALTQIKSRDYASVFNGYSGPVYLVGVTYGKRTAKHKCKIEVVEKD